MAINSKNGFAIAQSPRFRQDAVRPHKPTAPENCKRVPAPLAFVFQGRYEPQVEERMRAFCETLSEKDRRRFAALEAARLGHGGGRVRGRSLGVFDADHRAGSRRTRPVAQRSRRRAGAASGGWSKKKIQSEPQLEENLKSVLNVRTAGDPDERTYCGPTSRRGRLPRR